MTSVKDYALYCSLIRTLRQHRAFVRGSNAFVILIVPEGYDTGDYKCSAIDALHGGQERYERDNIDYFSIRAERKESTILSDFAEQYQSKQRLLAFAESHAAIPTPLRLAADAILDLPPISARDLQAASRMINQVEISLEEAARILAHPLALVWATLRPGRKALDVLKRLEGTASQAPKIRSETEAPPLSEMHGYGAARQWGLDLAKDLRAWAAGELPWSEVDRGIVLSGPPGVGKTIYAKALAKECKANLVTASLGQWQACGHLGDLLKAMRKDFARAKEQAPAILFIDEADSFGDRNSFTHDHRDYSVQVINAFLECLDGVDGREGIVVVGATNKITRIDPAIVRSGRLDKHVEIPLPDAADRIAILHQQLDQAISVGNLSALAACTDGMSGADLAKAVRDAKRIARRTGRAILVSDVAAALPELVRLDQVYLRANAIHEVGHTIVGLRLNHGVYVRTELADRVLAGRSTSTGGHAVFDLPSFHRRDRQYYLNQIAVCLGGIAAEQMILRTTSDGAGGDDRSDLGMATRLATLAEAQFGMGERLLFSKVADDDDLERLRRTDPHLRARVDHVLKMELQRASSILLEERLLIDRLTDELIATGKLTPERVSAIEAEVQNRTHIKAVRSSLQKAHREA
ncbi:AAA family ATPase [Neorhizobium galegae]|uniref:AAA family ATPase n=1 Tax=Neorhizobium galegae TaxID=399 RepID=UPI001AEA2534|nr:AAA family ATPase [Neorhizobium galegae]MBP2562244.1 SpoVK/Ycf46/Vps4 family AAA+-type ATPase [Neorhizobium galegae]